MAGNDAAARQDQAFCPIEIGVLALPHSDVIDRLLEARLDGLGYPLSS